MRGGITKQKKSKRATRKLIGVLGSSFFEDDYITLQVREVLAMLAAVREKERRNYNKIHCS